MAAPAPPEERVDGVVCETVVDIVRRRFWVISTYRIKNQHYLVIVLIRVFLFDCRPFTGVLRDRRRPRLRLSKPSAGGYFKIGGTGHRRRLLETTSPRLVLGCPSRSAAQSI